MANYERNDSSPSLNDKIHVKIDQITPLYDTSFNTIKRVLRYTYGNVLGFHKITLSSCCQRVKGIINIVSVNSIREKVGYKKDSKPRTFSEFYIFPNLVEET